MMNVMLLSLRSPVLAGDMDKSDCFEHARNWTGAVYSSAASHPQLFEGARVQIPCRRTVQTAAARILVQSGRFISVLDPLTGALRPLTSFGPDWTNIGSTGMGCNLTHCVSIGAFGEGFGGFCIGIFEVAEPTHIRAVPLHVSAGFSAPAFVDARGTHEWQVLEAHMSGRCSTTLAISTGSIIRSPFIKSRQRPPSRRPTTTMRHLQRASSPRTRFCDAR